MKSSEFAVPRTEVGAELSQQELERKARTPGEPENDDETSMNNANPDRVDGKRGKRRGEIHDSFLPPITAAMP